MAVNRQGCKANRSILGVQTLKRKTNPYLPTPRIPVSLPN